MDVRARLESLMHERIAILDGSWGVLLQGRGLSEEDFRGDRFAGHPRDVKGDPDLLNLTRPDIITEIHRSYLEAGADITTTNTFTATSIGQGDYGLQDAVYEMNLEGARLARAAADSFENRFVAGSVGPLNVTLSLSPDVEDPSKRMTTFDAVRESYAEQIRGLRDGGADLLLIETIFDTLNAKAAIVAAKEVAPDLPAVDLGHDRRSERPNALGADGRGVLDLRRARRPRDRRGQLLARRPGDACIGRGAREGRLRAGRRVSERGVAERLRRLRRDPRDHELAARRVRARGPRERARRLLRDRSGARPDDRRGRAGRAATRDPPPSSA